MPLQLTGLCVVSLEETANARVSPGRSDDHFIFDNKGSAGRAIVFRLVRVCDIPHQASRAGIKAKQVRQAIAHLENHLKGQGKKPEAVKKSGRRPAAR